MSVIKMLQSYPKATALLLAATVLFVAQSQQDDNSDLDSQSARSWKNRLWINRMPENSRDMVNHLAFIEMNCGRIGTFAHASQWRAKLENFVWKRDGNKVDLFLPQERRRTKFKLRPHKCDDTTPKGFDRCLTVRSGNRVAEFYSRHDWIIRPRDVHQTEETFPNSSHSPVLTTLEALRGCSDASSEDSLTRPELDMDSAMTWPSTELDFD